MAKKIIPPANGFTTTFLNNLKPQDKPYEISDRGAKGLRIKVTISGSKIFLATLYVNGKRKVFTLGHYPDFSLSKARSSLLNMKAQNKNGILLTDKERKQIEDNNRLKKEAKAQAESLLLGTVIEEFTKMVINRRRSPKVPLSIIDANIYGRSDKHNSIILSDKAIRSVTKLDIKQLIFDVRERAPTVAIELFALLAQFFDWAKRQEYIEHTPISRGDRQDWGLIRQPKKDVALDVDKQGRAVAGLPQITLLFQILDSEFRLKTRNALKILLLTATRTGEFRKAEKSHIDIEAREWFIPKENTKSYRPEKKNDTSIVVPLSEYVCELFQELMEQSKTDFVIDIAHATLPVSVNRIVKKYNYHYWTPHTLRKTCRTHIIGWCRYEVAEKCLNHSLGQIAATYDHGSMLNERREALQIWSDKVYRAAYGSESNVVPLRG